jgi:PhoPQ-activated pathogenicity-related protein
MSNHRENTMNRTENRSKPRRYEFILGPTSFFDMSEILEGASLEIDIKSDCVISSQTRAEMQVRVIRLSFISQVWHGFTWKHQARIYLPVNNTAQEHVGIIGTSRLFTQPGSRQEFIPGTDLRTEEEFAEGTALDLNIPIMIFSTPDEGMGNMDESNLMGFGLQKMMETGDLTWSGYYAIAKSYLRAITLMQIHPDFQIKKAVLMGCSKRGLAVSICAGADPERVAGVMITCFPGGNHLGMAANKYKAFGPEISGPLTARTGPGFQPPKVQLRTLNNPVGFGYLMAFDPYLWRDQIQAAYLVAIGTNDEFYGLEAPNEMLEQFSGDKAFLAIDNLPHTWISQKHLAAWRMWLRYNFQGGRIPQVTIKLEKAEAVVTITVDVFFEVTPLHVRLYYSYNHSHDWRSSRWDHKEMELVSNRYQSQLEIVPDSHLALYAEVEYEEKNEPAYVSSLVNVLPHM